MAAATASACWAARPPCLIGKARRVAGGVDAVKAGEPPVRVGVDEPIAIARDAAQARADQARLGDDAIDGKSPVARSDLQPPRAAGDAEAARVQGDAGFVEQTSDGGAGRSAEHAQRLLLRGDQAQLDLGPVMSGAVGRGHQCQVVERQRPGRSGRLDEGQLVDSALAELVEQQPVAGAVAAVAEGQHPVRVPFAVRVELRWRAPGCRRAARRRPW